MNNLTTIYIVRHGESESNAKGHISELNRKFGSPLTKKGKTQAKNLANKLKNIKIDAIFSSDLSRAKKTAEIIALTKKLKVKTSNLIRERDFNEYLNKINSKKDLIINEISKDLKQLKAEDKLKYKHSPNMESAEEGALRLLNYIKEVEINNSGKTLLIVAHGNLMRSLLTYFKHAKYDELPPGSLENTGYFIMESDGIKYSIKETFGVNTQKGTARNF